MLAGLRAEAGPDGCILAGFDFPIGLPLVYARQAGIQDFKGFLAELDQIGAWSSFFDVAELPEQISTGRPFYPLRPGRARQQHLLSGLEAENLDALRRLCERARPGRRAAAPLFWTIGAQQVGKAALSGWKEVLVPALVSRNNEASGQPAPAGPAIWPFSGRLDELLLPGQVVIAECYPAEFYTHLGIAFSPRRAGVKSGKRIQAERAANAAALMLLAGRLQVDMDPELQRQLIDGFGSKADGEDRFDATVGLLGMINIVRGRWPVGEPDGANIRRIEGWILGQRPPENTL
jgi:hypothetical protein